MSQFRDLTVAPKILITGGAGYIGSHTTLAFLAAGWDVIVLDDFSVGRRSAIPAGARLVEMNCADPAVADLIREEGVEAVVHFAGRIRVDESVTDPMLYYRENVSAAQALFAMAADAGVTALVFSSTAAVYAESGGAPVPEGAEKEPASPYGRTKLASELMLRDLSAATDLRHVILRYFNVAGADPKGRAGPRPDASHLIKIACEAAVGKRDAMTIHGTDYDTPDGTCVRDYIHVVDLATAHVAAITYLVKGGDSVTLNCGYGRGFSVREVVDLTLELADTPFKIEIGPRRPGDAVSVISDVGLLRETLDWVPEHNDLAYIIRTGMAWERKSMRKQLTA